MKVYEITGAGLDALKLGNDRCPSQGIARP